MLISFDFLLLQGEIRQPYIFAEQAHAHFVSGTGRQPASGIILQRSTIALCPAGNIQLCAFFGLVGGVQQKAAFAI